MPIAGAVEPASAVPAMCAGCWGAPSVGGPYASLCGDCVERASAAVGVKPSGWTIVAYKNDVTSTEWLQDPGFVLSVDDIRRMRDAGQIVTALRRTGHRMEMLMRPVQTVKPRSADCIPRGNVNYLRNR